MAPQRSVVAGLVEQAKSRDAHRWVGIMRPALWPHDQRTTFGPKAGIDRRENTNDGVPRQRKLSGGDLSLFGPLGTPPEVLSGAPST
jgi:hypothetical protein